VIRRGSWCRKGYEEFEIQGSFIPLGILPTSLPQRKLGTGELLIKPQWKGMKITKSIISKALLQLQLQAGQLH
jgi:hypothetical protein